MFCFGEEIQNNEWQNPKQLVLTFEKSKKTATVLPLLWNSFCNILDYEKSSLSILWLDKYRFTIIINDILVSMTIRSHNTKEKNNFKVWENSYNSVNLNLYNFFLHKLLKKRKIRLNIIYSNKLLFYFNPIRYFVLILS